MDSGCPKNLVLILSLILFMLPSERIHVPTADEAGMLPKASFNFINAHTRGPDTHSPV